jgi:glycosyltransferase involved in cell wall biosynthesis
MPEVTILLPTRNRATMLPACIQSVIAQTFTDWDLIILNDASEDSTVSVAWDFIKRDCRISINTSFTHLGTPSNRNIGIKHSNSEWILFIEDDIIMDESCLGELMANKICGKNMPRLITNGKEDPHKPFTFNKLTGEIFNAHACCLYPKVALEKAGMYSNAFIGNYYREETDLDCRLKKAGLKYKYIPSAVMYHNPVEHGSWKGIDKLHQTYYIHRNHMAYLIRNFGWKILYMVPCYLVSVLLQSLLRRIK